MDESTQISFTLCLWKIVKSPKDPKEGATQIRPWSTFGNCWDLRQDEHKMALVAKGTDLLKFFVVTKEQIEILTDAELYTEGEQDDMRLII